MKYFLISDRRDYEGNENESLKSFLDGVAECECDASEESASYEPEIGGYYTNEGEAVYFTKQAMNLIYDYLDGIFEESNEESASNRKYGTWQEQERRAYYNNQI